MALIMRCCPWSMLLLATGLFVVLSAGCAKQPASSPSTTRSAASSHECHAGAESGSNAVHTVAEGRSTSAANGIDDAGKVPKVRAPSSAASPPGGVTRRVRTGAHSTAPLADKMGDGPGNGTRNRATQGVGDDGTLHKLPGHTDPNALARVLLITPAGPLLVELAITVDDQPFRTARQRLVEHMLRAADVDGDGRLAWDELFDNSWRALGRPPEAVLMGMTRKDFLRSYDLNQNRQVDADEAERLVARVDAAGSAFSVAGSTRFRRSALYQSAVRALVDTNGDGILTIAEIEALPVRLMSRDANDDGLVALSELAPPGAMFGEADEGYVSAAFDCSAGAPVDSIYYQLAESWDSSGGLPPHAFALCPGMHAALDEDASGLVTQAELERLAVVPPPLVLACRFDQDGPMLELTHAARELDGTGLQIESAASQVLIRLDEIRLRFRVQDAPPRADAKQQAEELIARFDTDRNGYLTAEEFRARPVGLPELKMLDSDGDGKIFPSELQGYFEMLVAPSLTGVQVMAADDRDALFALLDADGDGRLGAVEISQAVACLRTLDLDGDRAVDTAELPATMTITLARGRASARSLAVLGALLGNQPAPARGPDWFVYMDFNRDGVVTPREFLGTPEQFSQLDLDGDNTISETEALRVGEAP